MKLEIKVPMLSLGKTEMSDTAKDKKPVIKKSAKKSKMDMPMAVPTMMHGMTAGNMPKPPTHRQRMDQACKDAMVNSTRRWTMGEISTKEHKENMGRAQKSISEGHKI